jgi:hypothetical protein
MGSEIAKDMELAVVIVQLCSLFLYMKNNQV